MGSTIKSLKKAKNQLGNLKLKMNKYSTRLDKVSSSIQAMMKGDGTNSYWQGRNAVDFYSTAIRNFNRAIANYKLSYKEFEDYAIIVEKAGKKSEFKGCCGAKAMKAILDGCTGAEYTSGVKKEKEGSKISTVLPATVNADAVNDDQTRASYNQYLELKTNLESLVAIMNSLETTWTNVKANTTGRMNSDAGIRLQKMKNRRKEIENMRKYIEENYIGDIMFS